MQTEGSSALKRRLQIVDLVRKDDVVRVEDLSVKLGVSSVTIRTDLNYLEQQGYVIRAFGKARYNPTLGAALPIQEDDAAVRGSRESQIAAASMRWIADDNSLFLSAGAIAHRIVPLLVQRQGLSLTMHDLGMVTSARQFLSCEIHVTGGLLGADEPGLIGPAAELGVLSRPVDLCIIAVEGIDTRGRVLSRHPGAARLYSAAIRHAKRTLALAYNPVYSSTEGSPICNVGDLHGFVVNHDLEPAVSDLLSDHEFKIERKSEGLIELIRT